VDRSARAAVPRREHDRHRESGDRGDRGDDPRERDALRRARDRGRGGHALRARLLKALELELEVVRAASALVGVLHEAGADQPVEAGRRERGHLRDRRRLAPDGRTEALAKARSIQGDFGVALRYALGEGELQDVQSPQLALTSFRSRFPFNTAKMDNTEIQDHFPDGIHPAQYIFRPEIVEEQLDDRYGTIRTMLPAFLDTTRAGIDTFPRARELAGSYAQVDRYAVNAELANFELLPTVALHSCLANAWAVGDVSLVWLQNREPMLAQISKVILTHIKSIGTFWQQDYSALFESDFPMHKNGCWWFAIALAVKGDDFRRLALDILIAAVGENRTDPDWLGETMAELSALSSTKWTKALRELARVSALHALASWRAVMSYLAHSSGKVNLAFLELALELYEEHHFLPTENAIAALKYVEGGGKAAKIAKQFVNAGCEGPASESLKNAVQLSFDSRIARVRRWQTSTYAQNS